MKNVWEEYYSSFLELPEKLKSPDPIVVDSLSVFKRSNVGRVLDLGCGAGRHCVFLAKEGFDVVGVDFFQILFKDGAKMGYERGAWKHRLGLRIYDPSAI
ncbi:MAG: methyltransferase domain-containing protein [Thermoproteota archaeon]